MIDPAINLPALIEKHIDLLQRRVSIYASSSDPTQAPILTRALGCNPSQDHRRITLYLSLSRSTALLDCLRAQREIAVVFTRPSTHESIQLKGGGAVIGTIDAADRVRINAYLESFIEDLASIDYSPAFARAIIEPLHDDIVSATFTPTAAFIATPGANAGQRLKP